VSGRAHEIDLSSSALQLEKKRIELLAGRKCLVRNEGQRWAVLRRGEVEQQAEINSIRRDKHQP